MSASSQSWLPYGFQDASGSSWIFIPTCSHLTEKSVYVSVFPAKVVRFDVIVRFRYMVHLWINILARK